MGAGRGWTLWKALITYAALPGSNSQEANNARRIIEDLVAERGDASRTA
jgi:hypothetical protein